MIGPDKRNAVYQLHLEGMPLREISRRFRISRHTVRQIIRQQGAMPQTVRRDKIQIDADLLRGLYHECEGWIQRVHRARPRGAAGALFRAWHEPARRRLSCRDRQG